MVSCVEAADHPMEVMMDMHSEAACSEAEVCTSLENGYCLAHCGEIRETA